MSSWWRDTPESRRMLAEEVAIVQAMEAKYAEEEDVD